ncbi:hypothetical protein OQA88_7950 [Cercophora sp. LCS_1]
MSSSEPNGAETTQSPRPKESGKSARHKLSRLGGQILKRGADIIRSRPRAKSHSDRASTSHPKNHRYEFYDGDDEQDSEENEEAPAHSTLEPSVPGSQRELRSAPNVPSKMADEANPAEQFPKSVLQRNDPAAISNVPNYLPPLARTSLTVEDSAPVQTLPKLQSRRNAHPVTIHEPHSKIPEPRSALIELVAGSTPEARPSANRYVSPRKSQHNATSNSNATMYNRASYQSTPNNSVRMSTSSSDMPIRPPMSTRATRAQGINGTPARPRMTTNTYWSSSSDQPQSRRPQPPSYTRSQRHHDPERHYNPHAQYIYSSSNYGTPVEYHSSSSHWMTPPRYSPHMPNHHIISSAQQTPRSQHPGNGARVPPGSQHFSSMPAQFKPRPTRWMAPRPPGHHTGRWSGAGQRAAAPRIPIAAPKPIKLVNGKPASEWIEMLQAMAAEDEEEADRYNEVARELGWEEDDDVGSGPENPEAALGLVLIGK